MQARRRAHGRTACSALIDAVGLGERTTPRGARGPVCVALLPGLSMASVRNCDYRASLELLRAVGEAACDARSFALAGVQALPRLVASELTTLSVCDLITGQRHVTGVPEGAIGPEDRASFDRHFQE